MRALILLALLALPTRAEDGAPEVVWVHLPGAAERARARALGLSFAEGREGDWVRMDGPPGTTTRLSAEGLAFRLDPVGAGLPTEGYHDPEAMVAALEALEARAPELVEVVDLGTSVEGRPLVGLRLGLAEEPRVGWRILGGHHGNEGSGAELALEVAQRLVAAARDDAAETAPLRELLARDEVWILPHVNPDGIAAGSRYNARTVDLNRNYGYRWSSEEYLSGDAAFSEPETRAVRALHAWTPFAAGMSMHSGAANLGWVWNYTTAPAPDADTVQALAEHYGEACEVPGFWLTNGADWYITEGDTTDWTYGMHGVLDYTLEASIDRSPPAEQLEVLLDQHWPGVQAFLLASDSVAGQVVDAGTGRGLRATVEPLDGGAPLVTGPDGRFARLALDDGPQQVRIEAPGHAALTVDLVPGEPVATLELPALSPLDLRPEPAVVNAQGDAAFTLPVGALAVRLEQPGEEGVDLAFDGHAWRLPGASLAPGAWDLHVDGEVAPRALLVTDADAAVRIDEAQVDDAGRVILSGVGFGRGSRAWAVLGPERALLPVEVLATGDDQLEVDLAACLDEAGPVDLLVLTRGRLLAAADVLGALDLSPGPQDTGGDTGTGEESADGPLEDETPDTAGDLDDAVRARGCGCAATAGSPPPLSPALLLLAPLIWRRRRSAP